jgi:hypothetical protein
LDCLGGAPQVLGNATFSQAVLNVLNILTGVGLLSIPFALRQAGWAGLGILWLLGFVTNYTGALPACSPRRHLLSRALLHCGHPIDLHTPCMRDCPSTLCCDGLHPCISTVPAKS